MRLTQTDIAVKAWHVPAQYLQGHACGSGNSSHIASKLTKVSLAYSLVPVGSYFVPRLWFDGKRPFRLSGTGRTRLVYLTTRSRRYFLLLAHLFRLAFHLHVCHTCETHSTRLVSRRPTF